MKEELDTRFLNRLMYIGGTIILVSILAFQFNYLGLFSWTIKIFIAISPVFIAIFISFFNGTCYWLLLFLLSYL